MGHARDAAQRNTPQEGVKMKLNQISIVGNVGKTIEEKTFEDGNKVTNFSIAYTTYTNEKKETEWFYVNAYGAVGEATLKELSKGTRVHVTGSLKVQRFEKKDGKGQDVRLIVRLERFEVLPLEGENAKQTAA
jgi:single-strand DNA-binding protein